MAGKIFIAKSIVTLGYFEFPTPFDHLFIVYDKDGNPFSTDNPLGGNPDEQVLIEGLPVGSPGTGGQPPFWSPPPIGTFPPDRMASATGASA